MLQYSLSPLAYSPALPAIGAPLLWLTLAAAVLSEPRARSSRVLATIPVLLFVLSLALPPHPTSPLSSALIPALEPALSTLTRSTALRQSSPVLSTPTVSAPASPSPSPPASPSPVAAPVSVPAPTPPVSAQPSQGEVELIEKPTLLDCRFALRRLQVMLLIEFVAEIIFLLMRCLMKGDEPILDLSFRVFTYIRGFYTVPVVILNSSILWIGSSPTGICLTLYPELQVAFANLILYMLFCIAFVIYGLFRLARYDSEKDTTTRYYTTETPSYPDYSMPTRTESYHRGSDHPAHRTHGAPRPHTHTRARTTSDTSDYDEPRFRINCGCCAINL